MSDTATTATQYADFMPLNADPTAMAFGAMGDDFKRLAPMYLGYHRNDVPAEYERKDLWNAVVRQWFYGGIKLSSLCPKDGIDKHAASRHVGAVLSSFEPDHESKEAIGAYLLSLWFVDFEPDAEDNPRFRAKIQRLRGITEAE